MTSEYPKRRKLYPYSKCGLVCSPELFLQNLEVYILQLLLAMIGKFTFNVRIIVYVVLKDIGRIRTIIGAQVLADTN